MIKCKVCKCWDNHVALSTKNEGKGLCRVLPPVLNHALGTGVWPFTNETDSCGAGTPK